MCAWHVRQSYNRSHAHLLVPHQIFLLTPKLLPDLEYSPDITVLQIMNGAISGAGSGVTWGLTDLLGRRTPTLVATHG